MAEFSKLVITKQGQALIAKDLAGAAKNWDFTRIVASKAVFQVNDLESLKEIPEIMQTAEISRKVRTNDVAVKLETAFSNTTLTVGYPMNTLGLYANDPDEGEILYAACVETSGNCYMPPYNGITVSGAYIQLITTVGNADTVNLEVNPGAVATIGDIADLQKQIDDITSFIGMGELTGHPANSVVGEDGVHGLRYYNNQLQVKVPTGEGGESTWATANAGGGSGGVGPQVVVNVDTGSTVKCSDGTTELTAIAADDKATFNLPNYGTWTLTGTLGENSATETITVDTAKLYTVTLAYFSATLIVNVKEGAEVTATNGTKTLTGTSGTGGSLTFNISMAGTWTVSATTEGVTSNVKTVEITTEGQSYEATLAFITMTITADYGSNVTLTDGTTTKTGVSVGAMTFYLPNTGVWTATATKDGQTATETVTVVSYAPYTVTLNYYKYYGVKVAISNNNTETAVSYIEDAVGMTPGNAWNNTKMFESIRPCLVKDGQVQYYLNPENLAQKANGGTATITDPSAGDVMVEIPKLGYKMTTDGSIHYIYVTDDPNAEGYCYRAHSLDAEGDCDKIYIGAYLGYKNGSALCSVSGKSPTSDITLTAARTAATARGTGYQLLSFYPLTLLQCLYLIKYKNRHGQEAIGKGYTNGNSAKINTGGTNAKGIDFGETGGKQQMCFLNIEDFWGNLRQWIDGLYCDSAYNVKTAFKEFSDTGAGYPFSKPGGISSNGSGWLSDIQGTNEGGFVGKVFSGSATSHWADYSLLYAGCCADFGGHWNDGDDAGPFWIGVNYAASYSDSLLGARLMYKHKAA